MLRTPEEVAEGGEVLLRDEFMDAFLPPDQKAEADDWWRRYAARRQEIEQRPS